jgi:hypothetical protein
MRWTWVAATLLLLPTLARADIVINISKSQQQATVTINGTPTYHWPVSTGRSGYDTPSGNFHALRLERVYYSKKYDDAPMPNSVFFYGGYAIHGTYEESKLGNPVSHGCVRLTRANAATLFALVQQHGLSSTRVTITDGSLRGSSSAPMAMLRQRDYTDSRRQLWREDSADRAFTQRRGQDRARLERDDVDDREFTSRRGQDRARSVREDVAGRDYTQRRRDDRVRLERDDRADRDSTRFRSQERRVRMEYADRAYGEREGARGRGQDRIRVKQVERDDLARRPKRNDDFDW